VTHEEAMQRADPDRHAAPGEPRLDLDQGHVALLGNQLPDEAAMRFDLARMPVSTARLRDGLAMLKGKLPPADRTRRADAEATSGSSATQATVNRRNNPVPKIL
jgi:hypothetical protein